MLGPNPPAMVGIEWNEAGHVDDVVTVPRNEREMVEAAQLKFHVDLRGEYSTEVLLDRGSSRSSLLEKLWATWKRLNKVGRPFTLSLVSNWSWSTADSLGSFIGGRDWGFKGDLFGLSPQTDGGAALEQWRQELRASHDDFDAFVRTLRWRVGFDSINDLEARVIERMENRGLTYDEAALLTATGVVARWVQTNVQEITRDILNDAILAFNLKAPGSEPVVKVCVHTIERQAFAEPPDFDIDWCDAFAGSAAGSREISDTTLWSERLLPDLQALKRQLNTQPVRLIRARGQARLTTWFALGHTLDSRARYVLEVEQGGERWRSDAPVTPGFQVIDADSAPGNRGEDVVIAIGVTQDIEEDVVAAISELGIPAAALMTLRPASGFGRLVFKSAGDVAAFVEECRSKIATFVRNHRARRGHLFYCGPLAGAAFLGNVIGAAVPEIVLYEDLRPGYAKGFVLRS